MPAEEAFLDVSKLDNITEELRLGDNVSVVVMKRENERGQLTVSMRRLQYEFAWERAPMVFHH